MLSKENGIFSLPNDEMMVCSLPDFKEVSTFILGDDIVIGGVSSERGASACEWLDFRSSFDVLPYSDYYLASRAKELVFWNEQTKYCSLCGHSLDKTSEISKQCRNCGKTFWTQISTAVLVNIVKGDEILLIRSRNFKGTYWGLVAGFVEMGETLEECVRRETLEETGLKIKNIKYEASQPWPYPANLMVGFSAEYDLGEIVLQEDELLDAKWFHRDHLPELPGRVSLTRRLIDAWLRK